MPLLGKQRPAKQVLFISTAAILAMLSGCVTKNDYTGSVNPAVTANSATSNQQDPALARAAEQWGEKFRKNPKDLAAGINYARHLRALKRSGEAVNVMRQLQVNYPDHKDVLGELGKALAESGNLNDALRVLTVARKAGEPDWRLMSTQGVVLDQLGRNEDAQKIYREALNLAPGEPAILSNLGLSLALSGDLTNAERVLREAIKHPDATVKTRENLALVLGLQGKFEEAEKIASPTLPSSTISSNTSYLKSMLDQPNSWSQLEQNAAVEN